MLFLATTINYMARQVLSLTWKDFIAPEFAWSDEDYGRITSLFSLVYAISMLLAGKFMDIVGVRRGYAWAVALWSLGAMLHAFCGIATCGVLTGVWTADFSGATEALHNFGVAGLPITTISIYMCLACRFIMAIGQAGNFPAAVKVTTEYFPKRDRAYTISIFNTGASVGALIAPVTIPVLANNFGWEMAFIAVGAVGYLWMLLWIIFYVRPQHNDYVNQAEYDYILQDDDMSDELPPNKSEDNTEPVTQERIGILRSLTMRHTWALIIGRFMTDGVWWFFLFWTPMYIYDFYGYTADSTPGMGRLVMLYLISMLSVLGGYLPTHLMTKQGLTPNASRSRSMLLFALIELIGFLAVPLGTYSPWLFVTVVGIMAAAHQSWSANLYSMIGDYFPRNSIGTVTGINGMAGGAASYLVMLSSGRLLAYAANAGETFHFMGYEGKQAAYMIVFCCFAMMYLIGWGLMRLIIPDDAQTDR